MLIFQALKSNQIWMGRDISSEIDYMSNEKVVGFSANQKYMSPSKFTGVGGESPNMIFDDEFD